MRFLSALLFFQVFYQMVFAQFDFQRTYGFSSINEGRSVKNAVDGGFIIAGITSTNNSDIYVLKLNDDGSLLWHFVYGTAGVDRSNSMIITRDSCYVIAGYTNGFSTSGDYDVYLLKIDRTGQMIWQKTLGGTDWDFGFDVKQTVDDGFIVTGNTYNGSSGSSDGIFIKTDSTGNLQWQRIINTTQDDYLYAVSQLTDESFIANGILENGIGGSKDIVAEKVSSIGDSLWWKQYGSSNDEESFGNFSRNGISMIVGSNKDISNYNNLAFLINENGDSLSTVLLSHPLDEVTTAIDTSGSHFIITGFTSSFGGGAKDLFISRIDTFGNDIQGKTYGSTQDESGNALVATPDGGIIAVGYSKTYTPGIQSIFVVKTDTDLIANTNVIIGISENATPEYLIRHNNSTHTITILFNGSIKTYSNLSLCITEMSGRILLEKNNISNHEFELTTENLPDGLYILNIYSVNSKICSLKFAKF